MYITPRQKRRYVITTIILAVALPLTVLAAYLVTQLVSNANAEAIPKDAVISNLTSKSITISWKTDVDADGTVVVTTGGGELPFEERRDSAGRKTHFVEVTDLEPDTQYSFTIISNGEVYSAQNGVEYSFKTLPLVDAAPVPRPVYGELPVDSDDFVVYLVAVGADIPASTVINSSNNWIIDLSNIKDAQGNVFAITDTVELKIVVQGEGDLGALHQGTYIETFDESGQLLAEIDLSLTEIPNIIAEIPESARLTEVVAGTTGETDGNPDPTTTAGETDGTPNPTTTAGQTTGQTGGNNTGLTTSGNTNTGGNNTGLTTGGNNTTSNTTTTTTGTASTGTQTTTSSTTVSTDVPIIPPSTFNPADRQFVAGVTAVNWVNLAQVSTPITPDVVTGQTSIVKTNLTDNNLTINWVTDDKVEGSVRYGTSPNALSNEARDVRDLGATKGKYNVHSVALKNLTPDTTYYYEIISGTQIFRDGTSAFQHTTFETLGSPPQGTSAQGSINGASSYSDMIVVVEIEDKDSQGTLGKSTKVSSTIDSSGNWLIGIGDARDTIGSQYFTFSDSDQLNVSLLAYAESEPEVVPSADLETSSITLNVVPTSIGGGGFEKFSPLADYGVIGAVYAFTGSSVAAAAIQTTTGQGGSGTTTTTGVDTSGANTTPQAGLFDNKPILYLFSGIVLSVISALIWVIVRQGKSTAKRHMGSTI